MNTALWGRVVLGLLLFFSATIPARATRITFGGVTTNAVVPATYGSRISAASAPFVIGNGWTPHIALAWSNISTRWDFYNDAEWPGVAQTDGTNSALPREFRIAFTADSGFGTKLNSFVIDDYVNYAAGHNVVWEIRRDTASGTVLYSGTVPVAANANVTVTTGMTNPVNGTVFLIIGQTAGASDDLAIDNLDFDEVPLSTVTWPMPDAIISGTALGPEQLNATANVAGTFTYNPPEGTVLSVGTQPLNVTFEPTATPGITIPASTSIVVKSTNVPVISVPPSPQLAIKKPVTVATLGLTADVRGTFSTFPPLGTVFNTMGPQQVSVQFTPANAIFQSVGLNFSLQIVPEGTLWTFSNVGTPFVPDYGSSTLAPYDPASSNWAATKLTIGSASGFGLPLPDGGDTGVLRFNGLSAGQALRITTDEPANGVFLESNWISNYTLIFDLFLPSPNTTRLPLWNTNLTNSNAAEGELSAANPPRLVMAGNSFETVTSGAWHRIAITVRSATSEGQAHCYLDGRFIAALGSNDTIINAVYAIDNLLYVLADNTAGGTGFLSSLHFIPRSLDYPEVVSLGRVHAAGTNTPGPPAPPSPYTPLRRPFILAHRGDSSFAPEDTLPAIVSAFDKGADGCEIDIRLTSDGVAILMHDDTVDRVTEGTGSVSSLTLAQIKTLDMGAWFGPPFAGVHPSTLEEVMTAVKGRGVLYLDVKTGGMLPAIQQAINASGFDPDDLFWWTYGETVLTIPQINAIYPNAKVLWEDGTARNAWAGWTPAQRQTYLDQIIAKGIRGFDNGSNFATIAPAFSLAIHDAGLFSSVYSLLSPESINRATEVAGVDGFETDIPGVADAMLPELSITLTPVPLGAATVRLRWTESPSAPGATYQVYRRTRGTSTLVWSLLGTVASSILQFFDQTAGAGTGYEYLVVRSDGTRAIATSNGVFATTPATGTAWAAAYAEWSAGQPSLTDTAGDPDGDGLNNFTEFTFATSGTSANAPVPASFTAPGTFTFQRRPGSGLIWSIATSETLQSWTTLFPGIAYTLTVTPQSLDTELVTVNLAPIPSGPRTFVRAVATTP